MSSVRAYLLGLLAGVLVVGIAVTVYVLSWPQTGWLCPQGEAPATNPRVTTKCFPEDAALPDGFRWDPGGNQATNQD